ncbi:DUF2867 domain-containing protein [Actinokineospora sp.]|uniref:DUF2867 domain-containing protein n=1 Tax=Actinokineospora sp. TaxID=1872133 RepID=UPI0040380140
MTAASCPPNIHTTPYGSRISMRLPNVAHEARPWRIRDIAPDFTLEDVWALPVHGGADDFPTLLELMASADPTDTKSLPTRVLWQARDLLGRWFDLGRISAPGRADDLPIPGTTETSLADRLPADLRDTAADVRFHSVPFIPLFRTDDEFAAELSNQTVHGVLHLAWVDQGDGRYQGQMAVYVKPRGPLGNGYMALIKPFRHWIVYPALMRQIERTWNTRGPDPLPPGQRVIGGFPRFGTHLSRPAPAVPTDPVIAIRGAVTLDLPLTTVSTLPRQERVADFHCVAGWSATGLRWAGVSFETVYRTLIEPALPPGTAVTHLVFRGLDGHRSTVVIEDALADEVLIADHLDGRPLDGDHGAPARLVSPNQYGYMSTKHLCRIDVHTSAPKQTYRSLIDQVFARVIRRHPRARVWHEERHPDVPPRPLRPVYRAFIAPVRHLSARRPRR